MPDKVVPSMPSFLEPNKPSGSKLGALPAFRGYSRRNTFRDTQRALMADLDYIWQDSDPDESLVADAVSEPDKHLMAARSCGPMDSADVTVIDCDSDVSCDLSESSGVPSDGSFSDSSFPDCDEAAVVPSVCEETQPRGKREDPLRKEMREWAVMFNVPHTTVYGLLKILKPHLPVLPLHPATLHLSSGPLHGVEKMGEGEFYYFGGEERLRAMAELKQPPFTFQMSFNVDGLPLFKSASTDFWPIMFLVDGFSFPPFVWASWCGSGKPPIEEYFRQFISDLKPLLLNGLHHKGKHFDVRVKCFICDAPALAFIKATTGHNGYRGCGKCTVQGEWKGRMTFPNLTDPLRTDQSFREQSDNSFHKSVSPLLDLNIDMISCFPLDYLHLICLGVMKRLLKRLIKSCEKLGWSRSISEADLERVNGRILAAKSVWPRDFSRVPRSLATVKRWTATEFRQFLLYLGPVVFRGDVMSKKCYSLFMLLHYGITLLSRSDLIHSHLDEADATLRKFVRKCITVLGIEFVCYNVHCLVHLAEDCRMFGSLDKFSAFPFENNELQVLKHAVRGNRKPLQQLVRRIEQSDRVALLRARKVDIPDGIIQRKARKETLYSKAQWKGRSISTLKGDNFVAVDNKIVCVKHFMFKNNTAFVVGKCFMHEKNLYRKPFQSSSISIHKVSKLGHNLRCWKLSSVMYKVAALPLNAGEYAVFPLVN